MEGVKEIPPGKPGGTTFMPQMTLDLLNKGILL
jgi:hypothetical protein